LLGFIARKDPSKKGSLPRFIGQNTVKVFTGTQACARVILDAVGRENDALQSFGRENIQGET
jgi:hypothetical protein